MNENLPRLREKTSQLTTEPGVYLMKDKDNKIIYIGKAKNLKNRVTSYFRAAGDHTLKVAKMVENVNDYDFIVTDSEYEALILECSLIKQHNPKYNILLKDDKGYHYIKISNELYPRITAEMQKKEDGGYLGPYTSSFTTRQAVNEVNKVFNLPTCKRKFPQEIGHGRPCLNFHIKQCMGVCNGKITPESYAETVKSAIDYIKNGSIMSIERLTSEMETAAEELDFEKASVIRDRITAIKRAADTQKIVNEMKDTDVIGMVQNGENLCISVLIYRGGRLVDKKVFFFSDENSDAYALEEFFIQYYYKNEDYPKDILVDVELPNIDILNKLLKESSGRNVNISHAQRGNPLKLIMLARSNASEYLSFKVGRTGKEIVALEELGKILGMKETPKYIEAYDISNLGSSSMVAGMVVFENGRPLKTAYKKFSIKENFYQNDYDCMREVLERRFKQYFAKEDKGFSRLPDLILLDGGKGHVSTIVPLLASMGINVPVFGMVKDNKHRTRAIATSGDEISVSDLKPAFNLITRIQDEVHRFSINFQRNVHAKSSYQLEMTKVKGIGEKKALALMKNFKTKNGIKSATAQEIAKIAGVNIEVAENILKALENTN